MLPFLLIILHFSQIGFTDDLTFTAIPPFCCLYSFFEPALCFCIQKQLAPKAFTRYYIIWLWKNQGDKENFLSIFNYSSYQIAKRYLCIDQEDKDHVFVNLIFDCFFHKIDSIYKIFTNFTDIHHMV